jgi:hypothetical protein
MSESAGSNYASYWLRLAQLFRDERDRADSVAERDFYSRMVVRYEARAIRNDKPGH